MPGFSDGFPPCLEGRLVHTDPSIGLDEEAAARMLETGIRSGDMGLMTIIVVLRLYGCLLPKNRGV